MAKARKTGLPASDAVERSAAQWSDQIEQINHAMDPFGIGASFRKVSEGWLANPEQLAATLSQLTRDVQSLQLNDLATVSRSSDCR